MFFHMGHIFLSSYACDVVRGRAFSVHLGRATHIAVLWRCMWRRGPWGNHATCLALGWLSVTFPAVHKQIGPFWCWFPGEWVCVCSRTLWVSITNSPVRLGVSPTAATPTDFYSQWFWGFISPCWKPRLWGLSASQVFPPGLSACKCGTSWSTSHLACLVLQLPPCHVPSTLAAPLCPYYQYGWMFLL